jgi:hypothetical protein
MLDVCPVSNRKVHKIPSPISQERPAPVRYASIPCFVLIHLYSVCKFHLFVLSVRVRRLRCDVYLAYCFESRLSL